MILKSFCEYKFHVNNTPHNHAVMFKEKVVDVDLGIALGGIGIIASGFALFQSYSHKKLSFIMSSRIKDLEDDRAEIKFDLKEQKILLSNAIKKIDALEKEILLIKKSLTNLISNSDSLASRLSHIDDRLINHEEKLLKMARSAAEDVASSTSSRVIRTELAPAIQTIKYVEQAVEQIQRELKRSIDTASRELEF
jgi:hypothetical protein